jgi:hypothetical protein
MPGTPQKMSEIMQEMAETLLRHPRRLASSEAMHVALLFANVAWNEELGLGRIRDRCRNIWKTIEADNPKLWSELTLNDSDAMVDELIEYKTGHYRDDRRRILACGIPDGKIRVEWLPPAAPGVDSAWEMQLYGLVRTGRRNEAVRFVQETLGLSPSESTRRVAEVAANSGMA